MTDIIIYVNTRYGVGFDIKRSKVDPDPEETFTKALKKIGKGPSDKWWMIEFEQDNQLYIIGREVFRETMQNFWQSVEIEQI